MKCFFLRNQFYRSFHLKHFLKLFFVGSPLFSSLHSHEITYRTEKVVVIIINVIIKYIKQSLHIVHCSVSLIVWKLSHTSLTFFISSFKPLHSEHPNTNYWQIISQHMHIKCFCATRVVPFFIRRSYFLNHKNQPHCLWTGWFVVDKGLLDCQG